MIELRIRLPRQARVLKSRQSILAASEPKTNACCGGAPKAPKESLRFNKEVLLCGTYIHIHRHPYAPEINIYFSLVVVVEERNKTKAATRSGLSQTGASGALLSLGL